MSELTKFEIIVCLELFILRCSCKIQDSDLRTLFHNVYSLLHSGYIFDVEDFSSELRKLYTGVDFRLYYFVSKYLRYLNKVESYIS